MGPILGAALIGGGAALLNSIGGSIANASLNKANRRWQEHMAALQYQRQRDLTQDTPLLQKQGIVNAGMSPSALSGFSGPAASVASVPSSPSALPEYQPFDMNTVINAFLAAKQGDVLESEADKNRADAAKTNKEANRYDELTDATLAKMEADTGVSKEEIQRIKASVPLLENQGDYYNYLAQNEDIRLQTSLATKQSEIDRIKAENKLDEKAAKHKLEMIDDIINAQYNYTLALTYNAKASGQAQLSQAYTSRLRYQLDKANSAYLNQYYGSLSDKLDAEAKTENEAREKKIQVLQNDADLNYSRKVYQDNLNRTYNADRTINNVSKIVDAGTKVVNAIPTS